MIYIGIDPGLEGAVAMLDGDGRVFYVADAPVARTGKKREMLEEDMRMILMHAVNTPGINVICAAIELVHSMPKQGVASSFTFGTGYGLWRGLLRGLGIRYERVSPQRWKNFMLADTTKDKGASRVRAQQIWSRDEVDLSLVKHNGRADALLIAEWLRRTTR